MPVIDLTRYIVAEAGIWTDPRKDENLFQFAPADTKSPERLLLRWAGDFVALTGPLAVSVTVQSENMTVPVALVGNLVPTAAGSTPTTFSESSLAHFAGGHALSLQASTIYSYTLQIAAGQAWPFSLSEQLEALRFQNVRASRFEQLGNNLGYRVIIEPAFAVARLAPVVTGADLPCDYAVADQPNTASFFPVACEPCDGSVIGLPHSSSVALVTPPADGGCVRTRFFNGMFITREDLETEQRYHRLKSKLHNRAAGAGVVWGFDVARQGSAVCVTPGYGVDCCGNDLTITTMYKVDVAALIADPAAARLIRQRGPQRMHLLLEYVECPTDPRPVHGDPCSPEMSNCEMSRIRESVRLRLVPPRDYHAASESAPIGRFLNEVRQLRTRFPLGDALEGLSDSRVPFQIRLTAISANAPNDATATVTVRPALGAQPITLPGGGEGGVIADSLSVEVVPDPLWTFVSGTLSGQAVMRPNASAAGAVTPSGPVDLSVANSFDAAARRITFTQSDTGQRPRRLIVNLAGWQAQSLLAGQDDPVPGGDLTFAVDLAGQEGPIRGEGRLEVEMTIRSLDLAAAPCEGEPCAVHRRHRGEPDFDPCLDPALNLPADPTPVLPWLHADPIHTSSAGDPKALVLEALVAWLSPMLVREHAGTDDEVVSARREISQGIYRLAWLLLFGVPERANSAALGDSLKRLLEAWCDGLLWKGPQCCGEPHGVVIGCAVVEGGAIQSIDPFGGRRHVVHYPLLEHWGSQFGIAPLDLTASRFFSKLCCLSALPAVSVKSPDVSGQLIAVGGGHLWIGDPREIHATLDKHQIDIVGQRKVATPEMIAAALTLIGTRPERNEGDVRSQYTALVLAELVADQTIMLLIPA